MKTRIAIALLLLLGGCASVPTPLQGQFAATTPNAAARSNAVGAVVRWGGRIVSVQNYPERSCFKMLSVRLDASGRPFDEDQSDGRFIACRQGFYDPEVFKAGRELTLTGRIEAIRTGRIGQLDYPYPYVAAEVVYLWPERREVDVIVERTPFWW